MRPSGQVEGHKRGRDPTLADSPKTALFKHVWVSRCCRSVSHLPGRPVKPFGEEPWARPRCKAAPLWLRSWLRKANNRLRIGVRGRLNHFCQAGAAGRMPRGRPGRLLVMLRIARRYIPHVLARCEPHTDKHAPSSAPPGGGGMGVGALVGSQFLRAALLAAHALPLHLGDLPRKRVDARVFRARCDSDLEVADAPHWQRPAAARLGTRCPSSSASNIDI